MRFDGGAVTSGHTIPHNTHTIPPATQAKSQTFLRAKRPQRRRAKRNGCFRRLIYPKTEDDTKNFLLDYNDRYNLFENHDKVKHHHRAWKKCRPAVSLGHVEFLAGQVLVTFKVARWGFPGSIPPMFEHKLGRH